MSDRKRWPGAPKRTLCCYDIRLQTTAGGTIRHVLITGANKGIGLATVAAILEQFPDVHVFLGARDPARGSAAIDALCQEDSSWSSRLELLAIDVTDSASVLAARDSVLQGRDPAARPLYGIVNNAGVGLGSNDMAAVIEVNTLGVKRVCDTFVPLLQPAGRVVNVSSASGPNFVSQCSAQRQAFFQDAGVSWSQLEELIEQVLACAADPGQFSALGLGEINPYGFSKACVSLYTLMLARDHPDLVINACTPGYIDTDLTRPQAERRGITPAEAGMKPPRDGTRSVLHLLFGTPHGSGHYYGSDAKRSPMDRYRAPGDPEYTGE